MASPTLAVKIIQKNKPLFVGEATSVSSRNKMGRFDILAEHASFISLIQDSVTIRSAEIKEKTFTFTTGVIKVFANTVLVLLDGED